MLREEAEVWGGLSVGCGRKGTVRQESLDGEWALTPSSHAWAQSYKQWGCCHWGFKAQWHRNGTIVSDGPPLFQNCFLLSSGSWSWGIAVKFPFWGNGSPDSILGSTDGLKGNAQSISIPYSFLHSKMYFPCVLVSTPFSCMSWDKWLKPLCCGFLIYKMSIQSNNMRESMTIRRIHIRKLAQCQWRNLQFYCKVTLSSLLSSSSYFQGTKPDSEIHQMILNLLKISVKWPAQAFSSTG